MIVRRLVPPADAAPFRTILLEALIESPRVFASRHQDWADLNEGEWVARLDALVAWAAFDAGRPVGLMCYLREPLPKMAHRATLMTVYVSPAMRRKGVARGALREVLGYARGEGILQMELGVGTWNRAALRLYEAAGFRVIATVPGAFRDNGQESEEYLMLRRL